MAARGIARKATVIGIATPTNAPIYVDADDNKLKMIPAGSGSTEVEVVDASSTQTLTNKTLTAPVITAPTMSAPVITGSLGTDTIEVVAATNVITAAESGSVFFLNHATEFVSTLPAPAAGLRFTFVVSGAPSGADYTIVAASGTPIHGMLLSKDLDAAADADSTAGTGVLTITLVGGKCVKGDRVDLVCDGTDWYAVAVTGGPFDAITFS